MKVLFIDKNLRGIDKLGFLYIAAYLEEAFIKTDYIQTDYADPLNYIKHYKPDWIMFSLITGQQHWALDIIKAVKLVYPNIKVCIGGPYVSYDESFRKENSGIVDTFVIGPGELVIVDIVRGIIKDKEVKGPVPDFGTLLPPYRDIMYKYPELGNAGVKRFITMRGCPFSCTYCFNNTVKKMYGAEAKKFLVRTPVDKVIKEILDVKFKWRLEYVYFNDDNFAYDIEWLTEFCSKYKEQVGLPFGTGLRADNVDANILSMLADAGMVFANFALETVTEEYQRTLLKRGGLINNARVSSAVRQCHTFGIKTRVLQMIGLPIENSLEEALDTLRFNQLLNPTDSWAAIYQPEPLTELYQYCIENHYYIPQHEEASDMTFNGRTVLLLKDKDAIFNLQKWWYFLVKYNVPMDFVKFLITVPLSKEQEQYLIQTRLKIARKELYLEND